MKELPNPIVVYNGHNFELEALRHSTPISGDQNEGRYVGKLWEIEKRQSAALSIDWSCERFNVKRLGMYRISIRYPVSAGYLTIRYYADPVK